MKHPATHVLPNGGRDMSVTFENWVGSRTISAIGTNAGAEALAFQDWRRFKEAFAPELVKRAVAESTRRVSNCLDPFGGSGTTALACQFLGVLPVTIEVNPYLADLTEAKLATYSPAAITRDFTTLVQTANANEVEPSTYFGYAPRTFVEPGVKGRWIFDRSVAARLAAYCLALRDIDDPVNARLLRVLLGGVLVDVSNVVVSGKGRRYRGGWQKSRRSAIDLDEALCQSVESAIGDIVRHAERAELDYVVLRGDARELINTVGPVDLAVFSPPYPNSFDYTDVYNVELWGLGYLDGPAANTLLRRATLASHVQIKREFGSAPGGSLTLQGILKNLSQKRDLLWDHSIPEMVGAYFTDIEAIIHGTVTQLTSGGEIWMVVGDSQYAGISIPVAQILAEIASSHGWQVIRQEPFRSMRASAQQGGRSELTETLLVLSTM